MNSSTLDDFLHNDLPPQHFATLIAEEVAKYAALMKKKGASNSIYFQEDRDISVSLSSIAKLLTETIRGNISNIALAYICDALTLEERVSFDSEKVVDIIHELSDPEINGGFKTEGQLKIMLQAITEN